MQFHHDGEATALRADPLSSCSLDFITTMHAYLFLWVLLGQHGIALTSFDNTLAIQQPCLPFYHAFSLSSALHFTSASYTYLLL